MKASGTFSKFGITDAMSLFMNKLTYKSVNTYCKMSVVVQTWEMNNLERLSAQSSSCCAVSVPLGSCFPQNRIFPPPASNFGFGPILAASAVCQLCLATTMLSRPLSWQSIPSLSPQNLILALSLLFSTSLLVNSDRLQWPYLATEMKTLWCCICKFIR